MKPGGAAKFHRYSKGPYRVIMQVGEVCYRVSELEIRRATPRLFNLTDNLKLYQRCEPQQTTSVSQTNQINKKRNAVDNDNVVVKSKKDGKEDELFPLPLQLQNVSPNFGCSIVEEFTTDSEQMPELDLVTDNVSEVDKIKFRMTWY